MSVPLEGNQASSIRRDIQGLRALAALLVAVYHVWLMRVSGGVDVFFVVSGFLITHSLLNRWERLGGIKPFDFLWGLYVRLAPPALTVIATASVGAALFLPRTDWFFNLKQALSSVLFLNNWHLALNRIDYLERGSRSSVFQHYWALSAQWQFYVLVVLVFVFAGLVGRTRRHHVLLWMMLGLFIASLLYSVFETSRDQPFTYFNTFARAWEFALGGLLSLSYVRLTAISSNVRFVLGWAGLAAIVSCGLILQVGSTFPGYAALLPTLAAAMILLSGDTGHRASVGRVLSWRPLVGLGNVSYSLYLWHWPVFIFWLAYTGERQASFEEGVAILVTSLVLAVLTHRLFSDRSRRLVLSSPPIWLTTVTVAFCLAWWAIAIKTRSDELAAVPPTSATHPGAASALRKVEEYPVFPGPFRVKQDLPAAYADGCHQMLTGTEAKTCVYGDPNGKMSIALVGGSHALHWLPALDWVGRERNWKIVAITKSGCRLGVHPSGSSSEAARSCEIWNENVPAVVRSLAPDYVFTTATRWESGQETVPAEYREAWRRLASPGTRLIAIRDTPRFPFDVALCVDMHGHNSKKCTQPRAAVLGGSESEIRRLVESTDARFIDLTRYFCDARTCFPTVGNVLIFRDADHLTASYVRTLKDVLASEIEAAMNENASIAGRDQEDVRRDQPPRQYPQSTRPETED